MDLMLKWLEWLAKYGIIDIIFGVGIISLVIRFLHRFFPRNLDHLHVHVQRSQISSHSQHENYDNVLGIFISNSGTMNIYIAMAFFRPYSRKAFFLKRRTKLNINPCAFKSAAHNAYEIKFGEQWYDFDVIIKPGQRAFTYLPLSEPVNQNLIDTRECGSILLEYATAGKSGRHIVRI